MAFILLNPSTADDQVDDPTIRRCIGFAKREGCGGLDVINLYAMRSTDPQLLKNHPDPEGPLNSAYWDDVLVGTITVVAAWGNDVLSVRRASRALNRYKDPSWLCFGTTLRGQPRHPLYLGANRLLEPWHG